MQSRAVDVGERGHFRPPTQDDSLEGIKPQSRADAGESRRSRSGPYAVDPMAGLATLLVGGFTRVARGAPAPGAIRTSEGIVEAQFVNGRPVLRGEVHHSLGGIGSRTPPVGAAARARQ